jgi:succinyl-CoA synthetase beta subunit
VNIHEYQAKEIFRRHGMPVPPGEIATTPQHAEEIARKFGGTVVVKAQVHAGGRGKAGGVKLAKSPAEAKEIAAKILGMQIKGLTVHTVLVAPAAEIATEAYAGIIIDRASKRAVFMVSPAGGIDIEEVAAKTPEKIMRLPVDPRYGLLPFEAMQLGFFLYRDVKQARAAARIMQQLWSAFVASGASLAEINPLVTTPAGEVLALDAKLSVDDNELDRRPEMAALRDETAEAPSEVAARNANLTFIKLDGDVGCVVNGAGLAMATMDLVEPGEGRERAQDHHERSEREGDPLQHLRRHHAHRRCGERHRDRDQGEPAQSADRDPAHRYERGDRGEDPHRERLQRDDGHG